MAWQWLQWHKPYEKRKKNCCWFKTYGNNNGIVRVYDWDGSAWTQVGTDITDPAGTGHIFWNISIYF